MSEYAGLARAHLAGELLDVAENDLFMPHCDCAKLLLVLVVFADRVDEGATVEALLAKPAFQRRKNSREFFLRAAAAGFERADEPFAPLPAFGLEHDVHEVILRSEKLVERGLSGSGLVDD